MAKISLFGQEALDLVKDVPVVQKVIPKTRTKEPKKHKATITISFSNYSVDLPENNTKKGDKFISVSFDGHNEGSGSGYDTEQEVDEAIIRLQRQHEANYSIKIIDKRVYEEHLTKWKDFIEKLCAERGHPKPLIWFEVSLPYDNAINVRFNEHRCWNSCVEFRFDKGVLRAYDGIEGGTNMLNVDFNKRLTDEETAKIITEQMEKVFNKVCDKHYVEFWNKGDETKPVSHRDIKIGEDFWNMDEYHTEHRKQQHEGK
jgi:hypothetical protein